MYNKFYTCHQSGSHAACHTAAAHPFLGPYPTEIDLVLALRERGVDLRHYFYETRSDGHFAVTTLWTHDSGHEEG